MRPHLWDRIWWRSRERESHTHMHIYIYIHTYIANHYFSDWKGVPCMCYQEATVRTPCIIYIQYMYDTICKSYYTSHAIFSINQQIFNSIYILSKKSEILVISAVDQNIQVFEGGAGEKAGVQAGFVFQSLEGGDSTIRSGNPAGVSTDPLGNEPYIYGRVWWII